MMQNYTVSNREADDSQIRIYSSLLKPKQGIFLSTLQIFLLNQIQPEIKVSHSIKEEDASLYEGLVHNTK